MMKQKVFRTGKRLSVYLLLAFLTAIAPSRAVDEIQLLNGTRIRGQILSQDRDRVVIRVGEGTGVYSKKAIRRIYDDIIAERPFDVMLAKDELPPWWVPASDLYHEDWVNTLKLVQATPIDAGVLENVPYLSFRANEIYELNVYGNPKAPAAIEIGFYGGGFRSGDARKRCRQFLVSYLSGLRQIRALYDLKDSGGSAEVDGLTIAITPRGAPDAYGGWWALIYIKGRIEKERRPDEAAWRTASEANAQIARKATAGETEWRKWPINETLKRLLPVEQMKEN